MQNVIPSTCDLYRKLLQILYQIDIIDFRLWYFLVLGQRKPSNRKGNFWNFWAMRLKKMPKVWSICWRSLKNKRGNKSCLVQKFQITKDFFFNIFPNFLNFLQIPMFVHIAGSLFVCQEFLRNYFWGALGRLSELNPPFILLYFPPSLSVCLQRERNNKFDTKKRPFFGRKKGPKVF